MKKIMAILGFLAKAAVKATLRGGGVTPRIEVHGMEQLQRAIKRSVDTELPKRMGEAHRQIGELVISKLTPAPDPAAVGTGRGAAIRPSASKREVLLRVGGAHRASGEHTRKQPWGATRVVRPGTHTPDRPNIIGTANRHRNEILDAYAKRVEQAMKGAFAETDGF